MDLPFAQAKHPPFIDVAPPTEPVPARDAHSTLFEFAFPDAVRQLWLPPFSKQRAELPLDRAVYAQKPGLRNHSLIALQPLGQ